MYIYKDEYFQLEYKNNICNIPVHLSRYYDS